MHTISTTLPTGRRHHVTTPDAANYCLQVETRAAIAACAGLDTTWGNAAFDQAYAWDGESEIEIKVGSFVVRGSSYNPATGERRGA